MMEEDDRINVSLRLAFIHSHYGKWYGGLCGYEN